MKSKIVCLWTATILVFAMVGHAKWKTIDPDLDIYEEIIVPPAPDTVPAGPRKDSLTAIRNAVIAHRDSVNLYAMPKKFSQTGFYSNMANKTVTPEALYYDVNSPLWSDGTHKTRWVLVPTGAKIKFNEATDYWDYPNTATFVKTFKQYKVPGDTSNLVWWETRVIVNKETVDGKDRWRAFTYRWQPTGTDADLIRSDAEDDSLNFTFEEFPQGLGKASRLKKWHYPNRDQCMQCHRNEYTSNVNPHGRTVLGFFTAQINRNIKGTTTNQITDYFNKNLFAWENKGEQKPTAVDIAAFPKWYGVSDTGGTLDGKARAYIAANCSGCHGDRGVKNDVVFGVDINYDFWDNKKNRTKFGKYPVSWNFTIETTEHGSPALLVPGQPDLSVILFRQLQRKTSEVDIQKWNEDSSESKPPQPKWNFENTSLQMPLLGTYEVDTVATKLIRNWILNFDTTGQMTSVRRSVSPSKLVSPVFKGRNILIPAGMTGRVSLLSVTGRELPITRLTSSMYTIPSSVRPGIYLIRVGKRSFTQYIF